MSAMNASKKLTPADPDELAAALAFALKFEGRKRQHDVRRRRAWADRTATGRNEARTNLVDAASMALYSSTACATSTV